MHLFAVRERSGFSSRNIFIGKKLCNLDEKHEKSSFVVA